MCIQDLKIQRATQPYVRTVTPSGTAQIAIPANPNRWGLILPCPITAFYGWNLGVRMSGTGTGLMFVTGAGPGPSGTNDVSYPAIILNLHNIGMAVTEDLWLILSSGIAGVANIVEIVFSTPVPTLEVPVQ